MKRRLVLLLVGYALLPERPGSGTEPLRELHLKAVVEVTRRRLVYSSETWIRGDRIRTISGEGSDPLVMLIRGDGVYTSKGALGSHQTLKALKRSGGVRPYEYVLDLENLLKKAGPAGKETAEGETCDVWVVPSNDDERTPELTLWVSQESRRLRKLRLSMQEYGEGVVRFLVYEEKVDLPDSAFEPDPGATYKERPEPPNSPQ